MPTHFETVPWDKSCKKVLLYDHGMSIIVCLLICCSIEGFFTAAENYGPKMKCGNKY